MPAEDLLLVLGSVLLACEELAPVLLRADGSLRLPFLKKGLGVAVLLLADSLGTSTL